MKHISNSLKKLYANTYIGAYGLYVLISLTILFPMYQGKRLARIDPCQCRPIDNYLRPFYEQTPQYLTLFILVFIGLYTLDFIYRENDSDAFKLHYLEKIIHPIPTLLIMLSSIAVSSHAGLFFFLGWALAFLLYRQKKALLAIFIMSNSAAAFACDCAKTSSVKANMFTFQTMVETYAFDHHEYPRTLLELKKAAQTKTTTRTAYWKNFQNPFHNKQQPALYATQDLATDQHNLLRKFTAKKDYVDIVGIRFYQQKAPPLVGPQSGSVVYNYEGPDRYTIYGIGYENHLIKMRSGADSTLFVLTPDK